MTLEQIRASFPITRNFNFLNHAAVAPMSGPAGEAMAGYAHELAETAYLRGTYYRTADHVRQAAARLTNAEPGEITFVHNTTEGINLVATGVQWISGDNVVSTSMEFPANVYPWLNLEHRGVEVRRIAEEDGRVPFDRIASAVNRRTRLVTVSAVQWSNGFRLDLTRLGELCREKGALFFVDAIQALGVHPIDVRSMGIDFLSCGGHKWLLAAEGSGIFYCRRELIGHLRPATIGYMGMQAGYEREVRELRAENMHNDARRFDTGAQNLAGICALGASLNLLQSVGQDEIQMRVKELTDLLAEGLRSKGWRVHSPRTASEWSGIVAFSSDKHDTDALRKHLRSEFKIIVANRLGRLRAAPHFYNSPDEIRQLLDAIPEG